MKCAWVHIPALQRLCVQTAAGPPAFRPSLDQQEKDEDEAVDTKDLFFYIKKSHVDFGPFCSRKCVPVYGPIGKLIISGPFIAVLAVLCRVEMMGF